MSDLRWAWVAVLVPLIGCGSHDDHPDAAVDTAPEIDAPPSSGNPGEALWAKHYGFSGDVTPTGMGVDSTGASVYVGYFGGTINFADSGASGAEALMDANAGYLAKLDANGTQVFSRKWTSTTSGVYPTAVAVGPSDTIYVCGQLFGTANFGGSDLTATGTYGIFVVKFDSSGNLLWNRVFSATTNAYPDSISVDTTGNAFVAGYFAGTIDFGGGSHASASGSRDYFVAKLSAGTGSEKWAFAYGDGMDQGSIQVAVDPMSGGAVLVGTFAGTVNFGGSDLTSTGSSGFIAKLDSAGAHVFSKLLPTAQPGTVATDAAGDIAYTGGFTGTVDFAATGSPAMLTASGPSMFVAKLTSAGAFSFVQRFSSASYILPSGVAMTSTGDVAITGQFRSGSTVDFSAGGATATPLTCDGARSFFAASFTGAGAHRWSFCVGTANQYVEGGSIQLSAGGNVFVNGDFYMSSTASISFPKAGGGSIVLSRGSDTDAFAAKLAL